MEPIVTVLPARGGSKRLKHKNVFPFFGKPMLTWVVEACLAVPRMQAVWVSSDDDEILRTAEALGCRLIRRPEALAGDQVPKMEAVRHAVRALEGQSGGPCGTIVVAQANSPELRASDIGRGLALMERHRLWEVLSVDDELVQNAAFRIVRRAALDNTFLSAHVGVVQTPYADVHTREDVARVEARYGDVACFEAFKRGACAPRA